MKPTPMKIRRLSRVLAIAFSGTWLVILLAGADRPPPPGFLWVVLLDGITGYLVYRGIPVYALWVRNRERWRKRRVLAHGAVVGLAFALFVQVAPKDDIDRPSHSVAEVLAWYGIVGTVGVVNAFAVYGVGAWIGRRWDA